MTNSSSSPREPRIRKALFGKGQPKCQKRLSHSWKTHSPLRRNDYVFSGKGLFVPPERAVWLVAKWPNQVKKVYFWGGSGRDLVWIIVHFRRKMLYMFTSNLCHCHPKNKLSSPCTCHHSTRTYYYSARTKHYFSCINYFSLVHTCNGFTTCMHQEKQSRPIFLTDGSDFFIARLW